MRVADHCHPQSLVLSRSCQRFGQLTAFGYSQLAGWLSCIRNSVIMKQHLSYHMICFDHIGHSFQAEYALLSAPSFESTCVSGCGWSCCSCSSSVCLLIWAAIGILWLCWCFCSRCLRCFGGRRCRHSYWRRTALDSDLWWLGLFHRLKYLQLCQNVGWHLVGAELGFTFVDFSCSKHLCSWNGRLYESCRRLLGLAGFQSEYCFWYTCFVTILFACYEAVGRRLAESGNQSYIFYRSLETGL